MEVFGPRFKPLYDTGMGPSSGMSVGLGLGSDSRKSKKMADDSTPRLELLLVSLEGPRWARR
jgi:hypothetical protein